MKFTQINRGHVVGLREILELLLSSPPETTAKQLIDTIVREAIFGVYRRTESGRHRTNMRIWISEVLLKMPNLPEEVIRKGIERIFEQPKGYDIDIVVWTAKLWFVPNLPSDLKEKFLKLNHRYCSAPEATKKVLTKFVPLWLAASIGGGRDFREENGVPLFTNSGRWELLAQSDRGALICYRSHYYRSNGQRRLSCYPMFPIEIKDGQ